MKHLFNAREILWRPTLAATAMMYSGVRERQTRALPRISAEKKFCRSEERQNGDELPGDIVNAAAHFILVRSLWV